MGTLGGFWSNIAIRNTAVRDAILLCIQRSTWTKRTRRMKWGFAVEKSCHLLVEEFGHFLVIVIEMKDIAAPCLEDIVTWRLHVSSWTLRPRASR